MLLRLLVGIVLTFFSFCGFAKPPKEFTLPDTGKKQIHIDQSQQTNLQDFELSKVKKDKKKEVTKKKSLAFYGYRQSFSGHFGFTQDDGTKNIFGFQYLLPTDTSHGWEAGIDVFSGGSGALHFGYRYILFPLNLTRPYFKGAIGLQTNGTGQLGTLIQISNLRGIASVGVEHMMTAPFSYRVEVGYSQGSSAGAMQIKFGLSWGWY